jgi:S1-C subfamily serine protease
MRIRLMGFVLVAGVALGAIVAVAPVIRGQTKGTDPAPQATRNFALSARPDVQVVGAGGPEIGVTIHDGDKGEGVIINDVRRDGPASKAGVKAGDVIVEFDGERVRSARQLTRLVQETPPGRAVKVGVMRDGKRTDLTVTPEVPASGIWSEQLQADTEKLRRDLREELRDLPRRDDLFQFDGHAYRFRMPAPGQFEILPPEGTSGLFERFAQPSGRLGVTVQELTPQLATYFGAKEGVLVTSVADGSAAAKAGLKAGDVITAVNDQGVKASADLMRLLRESGNGAEVTIAIVRDRKPATVKAKLEPPAETSPRVIRRTIVI